MTAAFLHTQGGLRVNQHVQVLRDDYTPITGRYASDGAAVGISGRRVAGYLVGNGLLPALGMALLAAEHVAAMNDASSAANRGNDL